jgi:triacylglycerol lipase
MIHRRALLAGAATAAIALLASCAATPAAQDKPPIVFVHGNGDNAAVWQTLAWRFESNGWPRDRLHAVDLPYPLNREDDARPQPGRTSTAEYTALLKAEVDKVLRSTGAQQVVLIANSRGGYPVRDLVQNHGGGRST